MSMGANGITLLEYGLNLGILLLGAVLAAVSWRAYARNRDRKLAYVSAAFALFALKGGLVLAEIPLLGMGRWYEAEIIEHSAPALSLVALLLFFAAIVRDGG